MPAYLFAPTSILRPTVSDDHVFIGQRGEPLQPEAVQRIVAEVCQPGGLESVTPHVLRHTFAKQVLDSGQSLPTVASCLGMSA